MIIKRWSDEKQAAIRQTTKIYAEACYFAMKIGLPEDWRKIEKLEPGDVY